MENSRLYEDIALRTNGDIYIGVVGPVRTGKSTFVKRFMETLVLPNIEAGFRRDRARDELPQSGSGRTVMTAEPKFVPEEAVELTMEGGAALSVRLIDCVGYLIPGAAGQFEGDRPRMVHTPWFEQAIPMNEAAEIGTRKVIAEHSTIGIVLTTDGTVTDIAREDYVEAEERVVRELTELGKPFLVLLNSAYPEAPRAQTLRMELEARYGVTCVAANCLELGEADIIRILRGVLYEFPLRELDLFLPSWVDALPFEHPIKTALYTVIRRETGGVVRLCDVQRMVDAMGTQEAVERAEITSVSPGTGVAQATLTLPRALFYNTVTDRSGFDVKDDGDLLSLLTSLAAMKRDYDKVAVALREVRETGYGIVVPSAEELTLEEPEIMKQGGRYGVRLRASAPSIHMILANIQAEVAPIVGSEKQSEELVAYLLREFEGDKNKIWASNMFGKTFEELVGEDLNAKLKRMPTDARMKLQETLQRIINEGSGGLICIIL